MADNTTLSTGSGGDKIRSIDRVSAKTQVMQIDLGGEAAEVLAQGDGAGSLNVNIPGALTSDAPIFTSLVGDPSGDFAGVNLLEQAMTDGTGLGFNVKVLNQPKTDLNNALVYSDAPAPIQINLLVGQTAIIVPPGGYVALGVTASTTAASLDVSVLWAETPA
jgi:hypothetical protein